MSDEEGKDFNEAFKEIVSGITIDERLREQMFEWELKRTILAMNEAALFLGKLSIELTPDDIDEIDPDLVQLLLQVQQLCGRVSQIVVDCDCPDCCDCDPDDICDSCRAFLEDEDYD